ncbi:MAG: sugar transferase [Acidimicrobiales bacterium]
MKNDVEDRHRDADLVWMKNTAGFSFQAGLIASVVGVATLHATVLAAVPYDLVRSSRLAWWLVVALTMVATAYGLGLPELPRRRREAAMRGIGTVLVAVGIVSFAQLALAAPLLPRSSLALLVVVVPVWAVVGWNLAADAVSWQSQRDQVFLVAEQPDEQAALRYELSTRPERPASIVTALSVDQARLGPDGRAHLVEAVSRTDASVIVLDTAAQSDDGVVQQVAQLHGRGLRIRTLALFYEGWLGKLPLAELARVSLLFDIGELHRIRYVRAKRLVDVMLGVVGSLVLVGVAVPVLIGNRFGNRGPLFFSQPRVGKDGDIFTIHKFRTMQPIPQTESADGQAAWTTEDDPRITPVGKFLRRSHLDELPQMVNVLRGELSIVGPRPEQPHYVDELRDKIPFYDVRHLVRPGLTGWAQVKQGYAADEADALEKLQFDFYYLRRQGLALDTRIIWRTARGVLAGHGR